MSTEQTTTPDPAPWTVHFRDGMWEVACSDGSLGGRFPREGDARTFADVAGPGPMTIVSQARLANLDTALEASERRSTERWFRARQAEAELARVRPVVDAARALTGAWGANKDGGQHARALRSAVAALDGDAAATPQTAAPAEAPPDVVGDLRAALAQRERELKTALEAIRVVPSAPPVDVPAAIREDEAQQHDALDDGPRPSAEYLRGYRAGVERSAEVAAEALATPTTDTPGEDR